MTTTTAKREFVAYHVYRQDHTGRGIRQNDGPLESYSDAEVFQAGVRSIDHGHRVSRVTYIVGERADGTATAYPKAPQ